MQPVEAYFINNVMDSSAKRVVNIIIALIYRWLKSLVKADDKVATIFAKAYIKT